MKTLFLVACLGLSSSLFGSMSGWLEEVGGFSSFSRTLEITVGYQGGDGLSGFPALVRLSPSIEGFSYDSFFMKNGEDLVFTDGDGNLIPHEIDTWNPDGESLVWVKLPSAAAGTKIVAYFGNGMVTSAPPDADFKHAVWSDYACVFHMGEEFEALDDASAKTAYDSSSHGFHAVAKAGKNQDARLKEMMPYDGVIGIARQCQTKSSKPGAYLSIPNIDSVGLGDKFTLSGWYYSKDNNGYPRPASRKDASGDTNGWEIQVENSSKTEISIRGGGNTKVTVSCPDVYGMRMNEGWHHYVWAFNGTKLNVFQDGVRIGSEDMMIEAATDNGKPISIGNNSNGTEQNWCGWFDEIRLCRTPFSAAAAAAECAAATNAGFLVYGEVKQADETVIFFDGPPKMSVNGDGKAVFSARVTGGEGAISAVFTEIVSGDVTTVPVADEVEAGESYQVVPETLANGRRYSVRFTGLSTTGAQSQTAPVVFYNGAVSVAKADDAHEAGLVAGGFTVSIPEAADIDFEYAYTVGGTAVPGMEYEPLSGIVTIQAGETSATIEVRPLLNVLTKEDRTVSVALSRGVSLPGQLTAELTVVDDPNAMSGDRMRIVSTTGDDDANDGTIDAPFRTIVRAIADLTPGGGTVCVQPGKYEELSDDTQYAAIVITNAIAVIGLGNRPEDVTVTSKKQNKTCHVFELDHPQAMVKNLWIKDGKQWDKDWGNNDQGINLKIKSNGGIAEDCVLSGFNQGNYNQQGQCCWMGGPGRISRCRVINNKNGSDWDNVMGTAIFASAGLIEDCLVASNSCYNASAVNLSGTAVMVNCTIADNTGSNYCGVRIKDSTARAVNCAIFNNVASKSADGTGGVYRGSTGCFVGCAAEIEIPDASNCVVGQPVFRSPGDYRVLPGSVCLDAGVSRTDYGATGAVDLWGQRRVQGTTVDIGCCESPSDVFACGFSWTLERALVPGRLSVLASSSLIPGAPEPVYAWELTNADTGITTKFEASSDPALVIEDIPAGHYSLKLVATAGDAVAEHSEAGFFQIAPVDIFAKSGNADAAFPYDTPETAAADVTTALATALDGSRIHLLPGTFGINAAIDVKKAVTITGEGDRPADTVIRRTDKDVRVMVVDNAGAFVANLTLADGHVKSDGACLFVDTFGGTVSNCVISGGYAWDGDNRAGGGAYLCAGLLTHSEIVNCSVKNKSGKLGVQALGAKGGLISNCLIRDCNANDGEYVGPVVALTDSAAMENCTIAGCKVSSGSASVCSGIGTTSGAQTIIRNCAIFVEDADGNAANCSGYDEKNKFWPTRFVNCVTSGDISEYTTSNNGTGWYYAENSVTNASANACFKSPATGNYKVQAGGPLVNAGMNDVMRLPAVDLAGKERVFKGIIDVGCYEGASSGMTITVR